MRNSKMLLNIRVLQEYQYSKNREECLCPDQRHSNSLKALPYYNFCAALMMKSVTFFG